MPGELKRDAGISPEEEIVCAMKNVFDRFQEEMSTRFSPLKDLRPVHTDFDQTVVAKTSSRNLCLFFDKFVPGGQNGSLAVIGRIVITLVSNT